MKRLILPLIAALALPTSVNAETVWLIVGDNGSQVGTKIEMESLEQCEEMGYIWESPKNSLIKNPQGKRTTFSGGDRKCLIG